MADFASGMATFATGRALAPVVRSTHDPSSELSMKYGARNRIQARVSSVTRGDVMSLVKFEVELPADMASVLTTESVDELELAVGDQVTLVVKAIHVMPVKA